MARFTLLLYLVSLASAWDINSKLNRHACQSLTTNPLAGCDQKHTLYVNAATNVKAFHTVQSAVASLPNNTDTYTILIAPGTYTEQVNVTRRGPTYLLGQTSSPTNLTANTAILTWAAIAVPGLDDAFTSTLTIAPDLDAALTGSGPTGFAVPANEAFGCVDFRTYNLDVVNDFAPYSADPSLAVSVGYANAGFYYTRFLSYQDTIYVGKVANAYFKHSEIAGQTDFFYGFGTAWVQSCNITLRSCGGGMTAWKGSNTTFENKYGVYIVDSAVNAANSSIAAVIKGKCPLGRPWNSQMRSIFARTYFDASILSTGFIDWAGTPRYSNLTLQAEYKNYGPGYNATGRALSKFDRQLIDAEWEVYGSPAKVFLTPDGHPGDVGWIDGSV